jgi:hypothetical protein
LQRKSPALNTRHTHHDKLLPALLLLHLLLLCGASFPCSCRKCTSSCRCCCCCTAADLLSYHQLLLLLLQRLWRAGCQCMQDVHSLLQLSHLS